MEKIRALRADEIEVRVGQVTAKGVSLLLYKDARCDKRILDEVFGINGWANCYSEIKGNLYCSIMIYDKETGMWIQKQDCGVETYSDKEKGEASDAFKRAGFAVGIGRELYTKIFIFVKVPTKKKESGKGYELVDPYEKWSVADIYTNEVTEKIEYLQIADSKGNIVFTFGKKPQSKQNNQQQVQGKIVSMQPKEKTITEAQRKRLFTIGNGNNEVVKRVLERFGYEKTEQIKMSDYEQICTEVEAEILM